MDKLSDEILMNIFSYMYDEDDYNSYIKFNAQLGSLNRNLNKFFQNRSYWQDVYYNMFPKESIPETAKHIKSMTSYDCKVDMFYADRYDEFGYVYMEPNYWRKNGYKRRCRNPDHYDTLHTKKKRKLKNPYKKVKETFLKRKIKQLSLNTSETYDMNNLRYTASQLINRVETLEKRYRQVQSLKDMLQQ